MKKHSTKTKLVAASKKARLLRMEIEHDNLVDTSNKLSGIVATMLFRIEELRNELKEGLKPWRGHQ